ncbi:MAG: HutD family protein [Burkholderiales bacterium]|nr:HutD family protein [Burkholderiales bacterium]
MPSPSVTLLGPADFRQMPWQNGGGTTCELYRLPHPQRADAFALRLSIAQVAMGGPFSHFAGVDRELMLLEGDGMVLDFADGRRETLDRPLQAPIRFAGELAVDCRLIGGPLQDFNVMVARDWGRTETQVIRLDAAETMTLPATGLVLIYVHTGRVTLAATAIPAGHLALMSDDAAALLADEASVAMVVHATAV